MFNHVDKHHTSAWQAQITGAKRWHICPPDQTPLMYGRGGVDVFSPDYDHAPLFLTARCYEGTVSAGEMVYYPKAWWHSTQNIATPTVSLSALVVDQNNHRDVQGVFAKDCASGSLPDSICSHMDKCYAWWNDVYGARD